MAAKVVPRESRSGSVAQEQFVATCENVTKKRDRQEELGPQMSVQEKGFHAASAVLVMDERML